MRSDSSTGTKGLANFWSVNLLPREFDKVLSNFRSLYDTAAMPAIGSNQLAFPAGDSGGFREVGPRVVALAGCLVLAFQAVFLGMMAVIYWFQKISYRGSREDASPFVAGWDMFGMMVARSWNGPYLYAIGGMTLLLLLPAVRELPRALVAVVVAAGLVACMAFGRGQVIMPVFALIPIAATLVALGLGRKLLRV